MTTPPNFTPAPIPTEQELAAFDHRAVPGPVEVIGDVRITAEPSLSMLPPEARERVAGKMANVRADHGLFERQFVMEELQANSDRLKVLAGPGKDANEYQRECYGIERERYDLQSEELRIEAELAEVVGHRTEHNDAGEAIAVPIYRFAPETRQGRQEALQLVRYRLTQLEREAPARRTAAAKLTQDRIAKANEDLAIMAEAKAQADAENRKLRVDRLAEAFAKNRRDTIG